MQIKVEVDGKEQALDVVQMTPALWIANGIYLGLPLEVSGSSSDNAVQQWLAKANEEL